MAPDRRTRLDPASEALDAARDRDINKNMGKLNNIGFSHWFRSRLEADKIAAHDIVRVISVHKDKYTIINGLGEVFAELSGNLLHTANSSTDLPTAGDRVYADFYDDDTHAIIHGVVPRKTLLK